MELEFAELQKENRKELESQFPTGYQLFGIIEKQIIPYGKPSSEEVKIAWPTAKILNISKDFIDIMLPDAVLPGNNKLKSNMVRARNQKGFTSWGIEVNGWTSFIKILKSDENKIIAVVGYAKKK